MRNFVIAVRLIANASGLTSTLNVASNQVKRSALIMQNAYTRANNVLSSGLGRARDLSVVGQTVLGVSATIVKGLTNVVDAGKEYELQLSRLRAATGATTPVISAMGLTARKLGPIFGYSAAEAVGGLTELGKAGLSAGQSAEALPGLLGLARAGYMEVADAATFGADAMASFGLQAKDFGRIADIMVGAADASTIGVSDLAETFKYTSAVAKLVGASIEETAAMTALLGSRGIKGSMAGTAMKQMFVQLSNPKKVQSLKEFGVNTMDKQGNMRELPAILADISRGFDKLKNKWGSGQKLAFMADIFDVRAAPAAMNLMAIGTKGIDDMIKKVNTLGIARKKSSVIMDNVTGKQLIFNQAVEDLKIAIFEQIAPPLIRLLSYLTQVAAKVQVWAQKNPALVKSLVAFAAVTAVVTAIIGVLLILITTIGVVGSAFKSFMIVMKAFSLALATTPVGWIILAVMALIGVVILIINYWKPISKFFKRLWAGIVKIFKSGIDFIKMALNTWLGRIIAVAIAIFNPFVGIPLLIIGLWSPIKKFFTGMWAKIKRAFDLFWPVVKSAFERGELVKTFGPIMEFPELIIKSWTKLTKFFEGLKGTIAGVAQYLGAESVQLDIMQQKAMQGHLNSPTGKFLLGQLGSPRAGGAPRETKSQFVTETRNRLSVHFSNPPPGTVINTTKAGPGVTVSRGVNNAVAR